MRRILFNDDLLFKIHPGTITQILMCITGITLHTAMLATGIGVHTVRERQVGAFNFIDNTLCLLLNILRRSAVVRPVVDRLYMLLHGSVTEKTIVGVDGGAAGGHS